MIIRFQRHWNRLEVTQMDNYCSRRFGTLWTFSTVRRLNWVLLVHLVQCFFMGKFVNKVKNVYIYGLKCLEKIKAYLMSFSLHLCD